MGCLIYIEKYGGGGVGVYRAETTHQIRPKRLTLKSGRNDPGRNDPAETTHGRNDSCPKRPTAETTRNLQRRATRWILSSYSPNQSVLELQQQLNLRSLEQRRVDAKVIMLYKIIHGLVAIPIPSYFEQPMRSTRHTRHPLALRQIHTTANYYKFSFFPSTVVYWNQLPAQIVLLPTLDQFSVAVRAHNHHTP